MGREYELDNRSATGRRSEPGRPSHRIFVNPTVTNRKSRSGIIGRDENRLCQEPTMSEPAVSQTDTTVTKTETTENPTPALSPARRTARPHWTWRREVVELA